MESNDSGLPGRTSDSAGLRCGHGVLENGRRAEEREEVVVVEAVGLMEEGEASRATTCRENIVVALLRGNGMIDVVDEARRTWQDQV